MGGIIDPVNVSLSKLQETVKGREAWPAGVYVVAKGLGVTEQLNNKIEIVFLPPF